MGEILNVLSVASAAVPVVDALNAFVDDSVLLMVEC